MAVFQEGGPLPKLESGLLTNPQKWIIWGDTGADQARDFIGKGSLGGEQEGKGNQEGCSAVWLAFSGFSGDGISFQLSLANHCDPGSFLVAHTLLNQDGFQWGGFWDVGRTCGISFWPFKNSSGWQGLVSSVFLTRTSCHKITHGNGYYGAWPGWAVSVSVSPRVVWQSW